MCPELVPGWPLHSYGLMLVVAFYSAYFLSRWTAKKEGIEPSRMMDILLVAVVLGIVGSRALFVIQYSDQISGFGDLFAIWRGGLVFYGGLITAVVGLAIYVRWKKLPVWRIADAAAPAIMLGLAFGKVGCFLNGCCFGGVCNERFQLAVRFPRFVSSTDGSGCSCKVQGPGAATYLVDADGQWHGIEAGHGGSRLVRREDLKARLDANPDAWRHTSVHWVRARAIPDGRVAYDTIAGSPALLQHLVQYPGRIGPDAERSLPVHPSQLYMAVSASAICGILLLLRRWRHRPGEVFALMALLYAVVRFIDEWFRDDTNPVLWNLTISQVISIGVFAFGVGALAWFRLRGSGKTA